VLIVGATIGAIFGMEGYVSIIEGESINTIDLPGGKETMALPFAVRCDKFSLEFYKNGAPKTYRSDLSFIQNNQVTKRAQLLVNHPFTFEGIRFYQSSYGAAPGGKATLTIWKNGQKYMEKTVGMDDVFDLPGGEAKVQVLRIEENLMKMGPSVKLVVHGAKGETTFWVFQQIDKIQEMNPDIITQAPLFNPGLFRPYHFILNGMEEKYYTGLQVSSDPGTPVVAAAAVLLICGLMLFLFSYSRQVWIRIDQTGEKVRISIAGRCHKNKAGLERELQHLLAELKNNLENSP
jgi:cytochrome c biogenesis protein